MELSETYIYALKQLPGFDNDTVGLAIELAKNDIVETVDEFIDFVNFNIEDKKFPHLFRPFDVKVLKRAVECAKKSLQLVHCVSVTEANYPRKIKQADNCAVPLFYKGKLSILDRKTIMITGSHSVSNDAKLVAKYFGKLFAKNGYNILSNYSGECGQSAFSGCEEVSGLSTIFIRRDLEKLSVKAKNATQNGVEDGRTTLVSVCGTTMSTGNDSFPLETYYRCLIAVMDCLIVPQLSFSDKIMQLVQMCIYANKPVFLIKYKKEYRTEYDCDDALEYLGAKFITSNTALKKVQAVIGAAR